MAARAHCKRSLIAQPSPPRMPPMPPMAHAGAARPNGTAAKQAAPGSAGRPAAHKEPGGKGGKQAAADVQPKNGGKEGEPSTSGAAPAGGKELPLMVGDKLPRNKVRSHAAQGHGTQCTPLHTGLRCMARSGRALSRTWPPARAPSMRCARAQCLVELCPGEDDQLIDLAGDSGAVGRLVVAGEPGAAASAVHMHACLPARALRFMVRSLTLLAAGPPHRARRQRAAAGGLEGRAV